MCIRDRIYTPSTKAEIGDHDENSCYEQSVDHLEKYFPGKGKELSLIHIFSEDGTVDRIFMQDKPTHL